MIGVGGIVPKAGWARPMLAGIAAVILGGALAEPVTAQTSAQSLAPPLPAYCGHIPASSQSLPGATTFVYRTTGTRPLPIHLFMPPRSEHPGPAALFFFGGGFRVGDAQGMVDLAKAFAAQGYVAAVADYRVLCRDNVTAVGGVEDAEAALDWLRGHARQLHVDTAKIVLVGGSAGGLLATSTAMRQPDNEMPLALVLFNPVIDLESGAWAHDQTAAEAIAYSPWRLSVGNLPPTIIFHGTADHTVPIQ